MVETLRSAERVHSGTDALKVPPHSLQAEQAVLGGLMLDNSTWDTVADHVTEEDFYRRDHRLIFRAIAELAEKNQPLDAVTLSEWLEHNNLLDEVGGLPALGLLAQNTPSAANIKAYADIVRDKSVVRQLISVGNRVAGSAYEAEGRNTSELLNEAEKLVFDIAEQGNRGKRGFKSIRTLLTAAVDRIDMLSQQDNPLTGVSTGFTDIDEMTAGLQPSDLIIVAGRPSMGKTTLAVNFAENAAIKHQVPVAIFSMEMPGESLALRMMSSLGHIDQHKIRTGKLDDDDWPRLTSAVSLLDTAPIFIDDTPALTPMEMRARARRLKREHNISLIVIDYLQLMTIGNTRENRTTEISEISRNLKALAKELNVPVIALSQLNRSLEQRSDRRPVMSDLRESGAIEQDADVIMFIYRDEVYNEESPHKGLAEIIIGKQRNGPIGTRLLTFRGQFTRFENYASDSRYTGGEFG
ncbi:MAG: replicative DNA helicase [Gammaproteobacteria bacterium]|jgi:replicative DNA helicase|nr:replicative DNA helicase [Gammaproteobacteria bacterium]